VDQIIQNNPRILNQYKQGKVEGLRFSGDLLQRWKKASLRMKRSVVVWCWIYLDPHKNWCGGLCKLPVHGGQVAPGNVTSFRLLANLTAEFMHQFSGAANLLYVVRAGPKTCPTFHQICGSGGTAYYRLPLRPALGDSHSKTQGLGDCHLRGCHSRGRSPFRWSPAATTTDCHARFRWRENGSHWPTSARRKVVQRQEDRTRWV